MSQSQPVRQDYAKIDPGAWPPVILHCEEQPDARAEDIEVAQERVFAPLDIVGCYTVDRIHIETDLPSPG